MKQFRGKKVIGWKVIEEEYTDRFENKVNDLMEKYDFEDFQFSTCKYGNNFYYTAAILISEKENTNKKYLGT
jgi:hypothetical protein